MAGSNINDIKFDALRTAGYTGASLQDMEYAYYLDTYSTPADFSTLRAQFITDNSLEEWEDEIAFWLGGIISFGAEATALFAAMSSQPTNARKTVINTFIEALKTASIWTKFDTFYLLAAHDSQASKLNIINPATFTASEVATVTFEADRGWTGNGSSGYLDSGFNPATASSPKFVLNSAHLGGWSRTAGTLSGNDIGNTTAFVNFQSGTGAGSYRVNQSIGSNTSGTSGQGHTIANRSASGSTQAYRNGASIGTGSQSSTSVTSATLKIGTAGFGTFPVRQHAAFHNGSSLSAGEVSSLYTALNTYMTAVGAA